MAGGLYVLLSLLIISITVLACLYLVLRFENDYPLSRLEFNELYKCIKEIKTILENEE